MSLYDRKLDPTKPSWTKRRDAGEITFQTEPRMRVIMQKMIDLMDKFAERGAMSDGYNEEQRDFYGGKYASWMMGCWLGSDIEPNKVDMEMEYWPIPDMFGDEPTFYQTSRIPAGWAMTTSVLEPDGSKGKRYDVALSAMELYYDEKVYQEYVNGECQFNYGYAKAIPITGPRSDWPPAQHLFDSMVENMKKYGYTHGSHIALDDQQPLGIMECYRAVMQEILAGNHDIDALLKMLDDDWNQARKGS